MSLRWARRGGRFPIPAVVTVVLVLGFHASPCIGQVGPPATDQGADVHALARERMLQVIAATAEATGATTGRGAISPRVMAAMGAVPRHEFVPGNARAQAYADRPLPIGHGQTISQPYVVALMTDLLALQAGSRVLEIGTGSAYQAAILAELTADVYSIEIVEPLAVQARERLARLGYDNVRLRHGDGYFGWPEAAPFDAIIVTAASGHVPPPLLAQLAPDGVMVIPVGGRFSVQQLVRVRKLPSGELRVRQVLPVRFVPLTGDH